MNGTATEGFLRKRLDDALRKQGCSPAEVVTLFSDVSSSTARRVIGNSLEIQKCYQLDFFYRCGKPELKWLMESLAESGVQTFQSHFMWQVLTEDSAKSAFLKYDYRSCFRKWKLNATPHPYAFRLARHAMETDAACRRICRSGLPFADAFVNEFSVSFDPDDVGYSLFQGRILSTDVFKAAPPDMQWKFISRLPRCGAAGKFRSKFAFSLVDDPDTTTEMKVAAVRAVSSGEDPDRNFALKAMPEYVRSALKECGSFGEFSVIMCAVDPDADVSRQLVQFLLCFRPEWILEWYDVDADAIDGVLGCRSVAEKLARSRK